MIELIQFPWSPFCLVQRRILEYAGVPFKTTNIPPGDRSLVWRLTRQRYYNVPIIRDGRTVVFETDDYSQIIAKYLDGKLQLNLFTKTWQGIDRMVWRNIEDQIEGPCFRLNDIYFEEMVPPAQRLDYRRHKERKFGRGCLEQWRAQQLPLLEQLTKNLLPFELMLGAQFHMSWIYLGAFFGLSLIFQWKEKPASVPPALLFFLLGDLPMAALILPTLIKYGGIPSGNNSESYTTLFCFENFKQGLTILARWLSLASYEMPFFPRHPGGSRV